MVVWLAAKRARAFGITLCMNDLVIADPAVADAYLIFVNLSILFWLVFPRLKLPPSRTGWFKQLRSKALFLTRTRG